MFTLIQESKILAAKAAILSFLMGAAIPIEVHALPPCVATISVAGISMGPLINEGQRVEVTNLSCLDRDPVAGDIVLFRSDVEKRRDIKRVLAAPGDRFSVAIGELSINGVPAQTEDGRVYRVPAQRLAKMTLYERAYDGMVPDDAYLVMGEQEGATHSSRLDLINIRDIEGIVTGR